MRIAKTMKPPPARRLGVSFGNPKERFGFAERLRYAALLSRLRRDCTSSSGTEARGIRLDAVVINHFGQTLVEVLIGVAIFSLILTPFFSSLLNLTTANVKYRHQTQAVQHAREALEIAYNLSVNADSWDDFAAFANDPTKPYHLVLDADGYILYEDLEKIGRFERALFFENDSPINRGDLNTVKVTAKVTWEEGGKDQEIELTTYLIDLSTF